MTDENIEDTEENPEVVETPVEEKPQVETETPKEKTKETYTDREKRYYARMKESEEIAKQAKADLVKAKEEVAKAKLPISDIDAILEVQSSTRDLDSDEVAELKLRASALKITLSEARQNKNYQVWQKGHREEVEKEKALNPSTRQTEVEKPKTFSDKLGEVKKGNPFYISPEREKLVEEAGLWKSPQVRPENKRIPLSHG